jgi:hypothetical protein
MRGVIGLVIAVLASGCASNYRPVKSPRIAYATDGLNVTYFRDGKEYTVDMFGGGLEEVVAGNPHAESEARTFRNLTIGGWVCEGVAIGGIASGIAVGASSHGDDSKTNLGLGLVIGGLVADVVGFVLFLNATPHRFDAVNIYNDGLTLAPPAPAPPPAAAPGGAFTAPATR